MSFLRNFSVLTFRPDKHALLELEGLGPEVQVVQLLGHVVTGEGVGGGEGEGVGVDPLLYRLYAATDLGTHPEVVKGSGGQALPGDVLRQRLHHARFLHGNDGSGYELPVVADCEVPRPYPQKVVKIEFNYQPTLCVHFGEHGLPVLGDHGGLVAVQGDGGLVEGLFSMA